jgi:hypothetical protein
LSIFIGTSARSFRMVGGQGEHLLHSPLPDGRQKSMEILEAERTIYIAVRDGRKWRYGRIPTAPPSTKVSRLARKRYGKDAWRDEGRPDFAGVADIFFAEARRVMLRDGFHIPIMLLWKDLLPLDRIQAWPTDQRAKYMMMRDAAARARQIGANGVTFVSEAWTARARTCRKAASRPKQSAAEALVMFVATSEGKMFSLQAEVTRKRIKNHKVKTLGPTERDEGQIMMLAPFLEIWGKLHLLSDEPGE